MICYLNGFEEAKQKLIDAKARVITSCVLLLGQPHSRQTGWSEIYIGK
jgi:hypothetical protein